MSEGIALVGSNQHVLAKSDSSDNFDPMSTMHWLLALVNPRVNSGNLALTQHFLVGQVLGYIKLVCNDSGSSYHLNPTIGKMLGDMKTPPPASVILQAESEIQRALDAILQSVEFRRLLQIAFYLLTEPTLKTPADPPNYVGDDFQDPWAWMGYGFGIFSPQILNELFQYAVGGAHNHISEVVIDDTAYIFTVTIGSKMPWRSDFAEYDHMVPVPLTKQGNAATKIQQSNGWETRPLLYGGRVLIKRKNDGHTIAAKNLRIAILSS